MYLEQDIISDGICVTARNIILSNKIEDYNFYVDSEGKPFDERIGKNAKILKLVAVPKMYPFLYRMYDSTNKVFQDNVYTQPFLHVWKKVNLKVETITAITWEVA